MLHGFILPHIALRIGTTASSFRSVKARRLLSTNWPKAAQRVSNRLREARSKETSLISRSRGNSDSSAEPPFRLMRKRETRRSVEAGFLSIYPSGGGLSDSAVITAFAT